ncbi:hypothetical protein HanRHA438_Chr16g0789001 [Helianthus annuus]|nr:hypothetical protein HanRHA438_Chr16g0789001 [Helianthus annuus]
MFIYFPTQRIQTKNRSFSRLGLNNDIWWQLSREHVYKWGKLWILSKSHLGSKLLCPFYSFKLGCGKSCNMGHATNK